MADEQENTVTMSVAVLEKLIKLNRDARDAVSPVGGNSVQETYKLNTFKVLDQQFELLNIFEPDS